MHFKPELTSGAGRDVAAGRPGAGLSSLSFSGAGDFGVDIGLKLRLKPPKREGSAGIVFGLPHPARFGLVCGRSRRGNSLALAAVLA